jgi:hypothetical protein
MGRACPARFSTRFRAATVTERLSRFFFTASQTQNAGINQPISATVSRLRGLCKIVRLELPTCTMADVEHVDLFLFLQDAKYHAVDVRLVPIQQVPQFFLLSRRGA